MQLIEQRCTLLLAHALALLSGTTADLLLDAVERADALQGLLRERRLSRLEEIEELTARMRLIPCSA